MPAKYLIEFLAQWIRDEDLRHRVLHKEETELKKWGLTQRQVDSMVTLQRGTIFKAIEQELIDNFGLDLDAVHTDINNTGGLSGIGGGVAGSAYEEGQPHVRGIEPQQIKKDIESIVVVRGHGWDDTLEIAFLPPGGGAEKVATRLDLDSDVDVWQRATVSVTLRTVGVWKVKARVAESAVSEESKEDLELEVV